MKSPVSHNSFMSPAASPLLVAVLLWTSVSLAWPRQSQAREWVGLTGVEMAEQGSAYAFAGAIAPLGTDAVLGQGWAQRYWLDWVEYRFESEAEQVRARAPGFSASVGYQNSDGTGSWAAYAGAGYRDTDLSPDRPTAKVRDAQSSLLLLVETDRRFAEAWRFTGAIQYSAGPDSYWSRAKFLRKSSSATFWLGVEIVFQGDPDYKAYKLGLVLDELSVSSRVNLNFKLGAVKTKGLQTDAYAGIELVGVFGNN
jgi:Cellulose biosynthesis protein BcsS